MLDVRSLDGHAPTAPSAPPELTPASPGEPGRHRPDSRRGRWFLLVEVVVLVTVSALVGATVALAVARATGWGRETVVTRYVPENATSSTGRSDIGAILAATLPSVVSITVASTEEAAFVVPSAGPSVTKQGTGVIVTSDGEVVTNNHVVSDATSITVTLDGSTETYSADVVGADPSHDLALLRISGVSGLPAATFGDSTAVAVGDQVIAVGYAMGLAGSPSVTEGIVSAVGREVASETSTGSSVTLTGMLQTDAAISSGDSGGPLVDAAGQVIGINTMIAESSDTNTAQNIGFAISSHTVQSLLPALRRGGTS